jgi:hypothetical protein
MTDESARVYWLVSLSSKGPLLMEFSSEAAELIHRLGRNLQLESTQVLSRALGLLEVWDEANRNNRIIVERPRCGPGHEYRVQIEPSGSPVGKQSCVKTVTTEVRRRASPH